MRRAKIVCTLGPATSTHEIVANLVNSGMDVARLNLSHGDHLIHAMNYEMVRAAAEESGRGVGILADLQGPKIRLARFEHGPVDLIEGATFTITIDDVPGDVGSGIRRHESTPTYAGPIGQRCDFRRH